MQPNLVLRTTPENINGFISAGIQKEGGDVEIWRTYT